MTEGPIIKTLKKTLSAGHGPLPDYRDGTKAVFHYEALKPLVNVAAEGFPESRDLYELVDSTRKPYPYGYGKPLELVFGKKFQLPVFETCLRTMHINEISQFDINSSELYPFPHVSSKLRDIAKGEVKGVKKGDDTHQHRCAMGGFGTGYPELDELAKNPQPLRFIFHLLKVMQIEEYEPDRWQLSGEQKRESVLRLRLEGNELYKKASHDTKDFFLIIFLFELESNNRSFCVVAGFRSGDFERAALQYREALTRLDNLLLEEKPGDPDWVTLDQQNTVLYLNLSQCFLNMGQYYEAIGAADEVLKRDPLNGKALFRRAKAKTAVWNLEEAEKDLDKLMQSKAELKNLAEQEKRKIAKLKEEHRSAQKSICKNMFKGDR